MADTVTAERARQRRRQFRLGVLKTTPLVIGVLPFGLAYGIIATQAGLTIAETMLMSLLVFAGASQFMAVVMLQSGAGIPLIVASTFLVNLRHLVMGLSISPYLATLKPRWHRLLAFGMADEAYLTTITHYRAQGEDDGDPYFMLGANSCVYVVWAVTSLIGAWAGNSIPDPTRWGLDFAMPATFLTMLLTQVGSKRTAFVLGTAALVAVASFVLVPGKWYIILAVVAGVVTGVAIETIEERRAGVASAGSAGPGTGDAAPRPTAAEEVGS